MKALLSSKATWSVIPRKTARRAFFECLFLSFVNDYYGCGQRPVILSWIYDGSIENPKMSDLIQTISTAVKDRLERSTQSVAHRMDHLDRVMANARRIALTIPHVDTELLELAVLLHDVDQPVGRKSEHVALSMGAAKDILTQSGCPEARAAEVLQIISEHSSEHVEVTPPSSLEAKVLFDADKLDGLGAIGVSRVFSLFGQMNGSITAAIAWYRKKIDVSLRHLQTNEGKRLCEERIPFVLGFLDQLEAELTSYRQRG